MKNNMKQYLAITVFTTISSLVYAGQEQEIISNLEKYTSHLIGSLSKTEVNIEFQNRAINNWDRAFNDANSFAVITQDYNLRNPLNSIQSLKDTVLGILKNRAFSEKNLFALNTYQSLINTALQPLNTMNFTMNDSRMAIKKVIMAMGTSLSKIVSVGAQSISRQMGGARPAQNAPAGSSMVAQAMEKELSNIIEQNGLDYVRRILVGIDYNSQQSVHMAGQVLQKEFERILTTFKENFSQQIQFSPQQIRPSVVNTVQGILKPYINDLSKEKQDFMNFILNNAAAKILA